MSPTIVVVTFPCIILLAFAAFLAGVRYGMATPDVPALGGVPHPPGTDRDDQSIPSQYVSWGNHPIDGEAMWTSIVRYSRAYGLTFNQQALLSFAYTDTIYHNIETTAPPPPRETP